MPETVFLAANNGDVGGGEQMLLRAAEAVRSLGREAVVVAPATPGDVVEAASAAGFDTVAVPGDGRAAYLRALRGWDAQRKGLLWCHGLVPALATAGHRRRIVHLHQQPRSRAQWAALTVARRRAVRVLTPSLTMTHDIPGSMGVPNWTNEIALAQRPERSDVLRVGYLGRLSTDKGVDTLADAVGLIKARADTRIELLIAGDDRWVADDQRLIVNTAVANLGDTAVRLGHVPPADLFSRIDIVVFPSRWSEPFGLVVAEAMAAGVPFIVSDAGALPEVAGPTHPWVSPAGDVAALAAMIDLVHGADPHTIDGIAQTARKRWETEYSPAAGRERIRQLLEEVGVR